MAASGLARPREQPAQRIRHERVALVVRSIRTRDGLEGLDRLRQEACGRVIVGDVEGSLSVTRPEGPAGGRRAGRASSPTAGGACDTATHLEHPAVEWIFGKPGVATSMAASISPDRLSSAALSARADAAAGRPRAPARRVGAHPRGPGPAAELRERVGGRPLPRPVPCGLGQGLLRLAQPAQQHEAQPELVGRFAVAGVRVAFGQPGDRTSEVRLGGGQVARPQPLDSERGVAPCITRIKRRSASSQYGSGRLVACRYCSRCRPVSHSCSTVRIDRGGGGSVADAGAGRSIGSVGA